MNEVRNVVLRFVRLVLWLLHVYAVDKGPINAHHNNVEEQAECKKNVVNSEPVNSCLSL